MYLDKIVANKQSDPAFQDGKNTDWDRLLDQSERPSQRDFCESLRSAPLAQPSIVAEMKRASPSKGSFEFEGQVSDQVARYERGGARGPGVSG